LTATVILHRSRTLLQGPGFARVSARVRVGLAVTVRAQHTQVIEPVIVVLAVDVVDVHSKRLFAPLAQTALGAHVLQQAIP